MAHKPRILDAKSLRLDCVIYRCGLSHSDCIDAAATSEPSVSTTADAPRQRRPVLVCQAKMSAFDHSTSSAAVFPAHVLAQFEKVIGESAKTESKL